MSFLLTFFIFSLRNDNNFFLILGKLIPINKAGINPTSDKTEYLPPICSLCSTKNRFNFLARLHSKLFLFSEIIITFFAFALRIFNEKILDNVSIVFPDFETIMKRILFKFSFFFRFINSFSFRSLKK